MTDRLADVLRELVRTEVRAEVAAQHAAPVPPRLLSVAETAAALGLSRAMLYRLLSDGAIRSLHVGRRRLIPASEIAAYINGVPT